MYRCADFRLIVFRTLIHDMLVILSCFSSVWALCRVVMTGAAVGIIYFKFLNIFSYYHESL